MASPVQPQLGSLVEAYQTTKCRNCGARIIWQTSFKTGGKYPTDVKEIVQTIGIVLVTGRNWFHKCNPADIDLFNQQKAAAAPPLIDVTKPDAVYQPFGKSQAAKRRGMIAFVEAATEPQLRKALQVIFNRQTRSEQAIEATQDRNGVGFSGADAEILSNIFKGSQQYNGLRGKQVDLVRKKMKKYAKQLVEALENGEWQI